MEKILQIVPTFSFIFYQHLYLEQTYKEFSVSIYLKKFLGFEGPKMPFGPGGPTPWGK